MEISTSNLKIRLLFILLLPPFLSFAQINGNYLLSGIVKDDNGQTLPGVSVKITGSTAGTISDTQGRFSIATNAKFPLHLVFSSIGFKPQEFVVNKPGSQLNIQLVTQSMIVNEVVVTASRQEERIMRSPVAIEKLDIRAIRNSPAPSFYDALENVKGVQMTTSSLTFKVPNTRGFNIPNNFRFMQMVDGVDMQAATLGVPLGNAIGPTELDIASVEITPGAASALYGMNAINGMANLITKNPFAYQGLSVYQRTGVNHVDGIDHSPSVLTETAVRYAKAFNHKWAFKINGSYMHGIDWISNSQQDQNPNYLPSANPAFPQLNGANNTAYDAWNRYGDDALAGSNLVSISGLTINGKANQTLRVARTGYYEKDLVDPEVKNIKADAELHFKPNEHTEITYSYRIGDMDGTFQRGNKIRLDGVIVQNHKLEVKGKNFKILSYISLENTGNSYNVKPLADNLDLYSGGSNSVWAAKYKTALVAQLNNGVDLATANNMARAAADASRVVPGTQAFNDLKNTIIGINNWDIKSSLIPDAPATGGAALVQKSRMYHVEGQWDLSKTVKIFDLLIGADARLYQIIPDGNNFVDFSRPIADRNKQLPDGSFGNDVYYKKVGAFAQGTKAFFDEKLKLVGSLRFDYNPYYDPKVTPRIAAVYSPVDNHNFRVTFQQGYRFPSLFEALSYVNNGRVKRVGSLSFIDQGLGYLENSYTQTSVINFNNAVAAAGNTDAAALANRNLLQVADLPKARPEKINSFEVGYKSVVLDNKVVIDWDAYSNIYNGFLGQVQVYVPKATTVGTDAAVLAMLDRNRDPAAATTTTAASAGQDRYRVYTNAKNDYHNYGSALGVTYNFYQKFSLAGNISFNKLVANKTDDIFVTGFNTPILSTNLSFGNREIVKNLGFNVIYKWQQGFLWESPLVTGNVPAIHTFDAQVSLRVPQYKANFKLGATDLLDRRYIQYAGGPTIGGLYYLAITLDGLLEK
ncbi:TonB-dependent receptor [Mucilaginibacter arboris]|uniref:TonB-dependent receptor plug domain-containing protein n=1 Tax=Mucilaginibacter arboris TaxID=2682090 RepID=A0A7K1SYP4_9SPHI|nr:TonB-dependent receptor [Mucilaginibacter arboris]MVN22423.1 TonB-dependent receptor plug domain-containing protein [Mucilaginibacter arboris]